MIPRYTIASHRNTCIPGLKVAGIPNPSEERELDKMLSSSSINESENLNVFENVFDNDKMAMAYGSNSPRGWLSGVPVRGPR